MMIQPDGTPYDYPRSPSPRCPTTTRMSSIPVSWNNRTTPSSTDIGSYGRSSLNPSIRDEFQADSARDHLKGPSSERTSQGQSPTEAISSGSLVLI